MLNRKLEKHRERIQYSHEKQIREWIDWRFSTTFRILVCPVIVSNEAQRASVFRVLHYGWTRLRCLGSTISLLVVFEVYIEPVDLPLVSLILT